LVIHFGVPAQEAVTIFVGCRDVDCGVEVQTAILERGRCDVAAVWVHGEMANALFWDAWDATRASAECQGGRSVYFFSRSSLFCGHLDISNVVKGCYR
jgi:hypothetical protein